MQKGFTPIIILVGVVVLIGLAGGVYFFQKQQAIRNINSFEECAKAGYPIMESYPARCATPDGRSFTQILSEEEKKKLIPPSKPTSSGEMADWKTYTNTQAGYSIKYPNNLILREVKFPSSSSDYSKIYGTLVLERGNYSFSVNITAARSSKNLTLDHLLGNGPQLSYVSDYLMDKTIRKIKVDGANGIQVDGIRAGPGDESTTDIMIIKNSTVYQVVLLPSTSSNLEVLDQILSTFKFIEASPSPTSTSKNQCGDGVCQEVVCLAVGCPKPETPQSCPADCK